MNGTRSLLDELETALASGSTSRGIEILTSVTDLFIDGAPRFSEDQIGVFDDVMARLMVRPSRPRRAPSWRSVWRRSPTRPATSSSCSPSDDDIEVARPVLTRSERLNEHTLVATANSKSQQHLYAIAQRDALSEAVTDILVERGDRDVVHSVVKNRGARFSDAGLPHPGHALGRRRRAGERSRHAQRHSAAALPDASRKSLERGARPPRRREPASLDDNRRRHGRSGRRHSQRAAQRLAGLRRGGGGGGAAEPHPPHRRGRDLPVCPRPQVRGNRDRAIDVVRHADRRRRAGAARPGRRDRADPGQGRGPVVDHDQSGPAAARRRPRHVDRRPRTAR